MVVHFWLYLIFSLIVRFLPELECSFSTGKGGAHGDGDIYVPDNLTAFQKFVLDSTDQKGVHFVMGDGVRPLSLLLMAPKLSLSLNVEVKSLPVQGFSVEGQENIQEILSKRLYLCQCLMAMMVLRPGEPSVPYVFRGVSFQFQNGIFFFFISSATTSNYVSD